MSSRRRISARPERTERRTKKILKSVNMGAPDGVLVLVICSLMIFGLAAVFSAGAPEGVELYGNVAYFLKKHFIAMALGGVAMVFAYLINYKFWKKHTYKIAVGVLILVGATLVSGLGTKMYGSTRWLFGIQPSEFCKVATILLVSSALVESKNLLEGKMLLNLSIIGLMIIMLLLQPNLSIAIILTAITLVLLFIGGASFRCLAFSTTGAGIMALWMFMKPYQMARLKGWIDPWADPQGIGYNLIQSYYAIGSGGLMGVGYGNSRQKLFWLPFSHTDFIFAVIAEELGLIGCLVLIGLFLALLQRGFYIANRCSDKFGRFLAFGITFSIILQAFINIGVAVGVLPVTGVTLPLISHGGTSVVLTMFMLGILLNISRKRTKNINTQQRLNRA